MDHRLLGNGQCQDTPAQAPFGGVPATLAATAVEGVLHRCEDGHPHIRYVVFLYRTSPKTLDAAFKTVLQGWKATGQWHTAPNACHTAGVSSGGPVKWLHPSEAPQRPAISAAIAPASTINH